jgi:hypothetical protein
MGVLGDCCLKNGESQKEFKELFKESFKLICQAAVLIGLVAAVTIMVAKR